MVMLLNSKRGMVDVPFNLIFVGIAGVMFIIFFISIVSYMSSSSTSELDVNIMKNIQVVLSGSESSSNVFKLTSGLPNVELKFYSDYEGTMGNCYVSDIDLFVNGMIDNKFKYRPVFTPGILTGRSFYTISKEFNAPFKVANLLMIGNYDTKFFYSDKVGVNGNSLIFKTFPNQTQAIDFNECGLGSGSECFTNKKGAAKNIKVIKVVKGVDDLSCDLMNELVGGNWFVRDDINMDGVVIGIDSDSTGCNFENLDSCFGVVKFCKFKRDDTIRKFVDNDISDVGSCSNEDYIYGERSFYGEAMIYAAIFSKNRLVYDSGMQYVLTRFNTMSNLVGERVKYFNGDYDPGFTNRMGFLSETCQKMYGSYNLLDGFKPELNSVFMLSEGCFSNSDVNDICVGENLNLYSSYLSSLNNNLYLKSCPTII